MPFYLFQRTERKDGNIVREYFQMVREVRLAGYNSIYNLWVQMGKSKDQGWHIDIHNLLKEITKGTGNYNSHRLIIDFDPKAKWRIGLIEVLDIYLYTYGYSTNNAFWSALMLRLRDVYYDEFEQDKDPKDIEDMKRKFCIDKRKEDSDQDVFEFLYLKGDDGGWNRGRVGQVNAVFIHKEARDYFKNFFCR